MQCFDPSLIGACLNGRVNNHYGDIIIGTIASQITSLTIVYSTVYSDADQRKHQSSASLAFVLGIHRGPVNSPHKWLVTRKMFPFDDVIMRETGDLRRHRAHCDVIVVCCHIPTAYIMLWNQQLQVHSGVLLTFNLMYNTNMKKEHTISLILFLSKFQNIYVENS